MGITNHQSMQNAMNSMGSQIGQNQFDMQQGKPGYPYQADPYEEMRRQHHAQMMQHMLASQQYASHASVHVEPVRKVDDDPVLPVAHGMRKHLQSRVDKWLKGVELPLH